MSRGIGARKPARTHAYTRASDHTHVRRVAVTPVRATRSKDSHVTVHTEEFCAHETMGTAAALAKEKRLTLLLRSVEEHVFFLVFWPRVHSFVYRDAHTRERQRRLLPRGQS